MYKLAAFDIDGTLVNDDKEVTESTLRGLAHLQDQGVHVAISTGRPLKGVHKVLDQIDQDLVDYASCFNGSVIYQLKEKRIIFETYLQVDQVHEITQFALAHEVDVHGHSASQVLVHRDPIDRYVGVESGILDMPITQTDFLADDVHFPKLMITGEAERILEIEEEIPSDWYQRYNIVKSEPYYLEFNPKASSKGLALEHLCELLDVDQAQSMAFGDQENDLSMIEWAGCGIAMGNAIQSLKDIADYVTHDNNTDGIEHAAKTLVK
ncbi:MULTISPECIES: Cof-type HAD-IIB family hydrolase [Aerococcus]|uniref:Cof-type HAD-IIB family hydrolase n=1 Tax=Aerococcus sanguinicola TaxID=119206 RepID=A0A5N1GE61_9LACT|nr:MULTISPECIES: Cof-type HAD-IIB family hydrolase [Aerococcus]KAA9299215.1 Cof-type HAD-IIB family hydrolase [Aerococcus sanguinicola]MDK6370187.1 Cof-type HAD-IIB family hydrolase [Aerococcus sp. UMB9870]MDK6680753.1 Cof-type HAD-IIB family hydrolase [Aerococcus sp. UMB8608]MDK6687593.1 Cof-type HAD-IIB family hydrolase [Aerococcus sp. UMB8623]MDK6940715.1 Cof-type HAD-IIB family hydrolase [Aerococcus sp. UMB8487]